MASQEKQSNFKDSAQKEIDEIHARIKAERIASDPHVSHEPHKYAFRPNHIPITVRLRYFISSITLIIYGGIGLMIDDLVIPLKHSSEPLHLHGYVAQAMYCCILLASANMISVVIDHYDKRNNELTYQKFASYTETCGWILFFMTLLLGIFENW